MKMRTGNSKPRSPDDKIIVGGGIVEKKLQQISAEIINAEADIESRGKRNYFIIFDAALYQKFLELIYAKIIN